MTIGCIFSILFLAILTFIWLETVKGEVFPECEGITNKTFTGSSKKCSGYIFCDGEESFDGNCEEGEYFNADDGVCDDKAFVNCQIEEEEGTIALITTTTTTVKPEPAKELTTLPAATQDTTKTTNAVATTTLATVITTLITDNAISSSTDSAITATSFSVTPSTISPTTLLCPPEDNPSQIVFLSHIKSCSTYYVCINGTPIEMFCSSMLHFNVKTGKCDFPENVKCMSGFLQPKEQCRRHVVDFYPHSSNCNYYYLCQSGFLMLEQCPFMFGWDIEKRTCVALNKAKCFNQVARFLLY